MTTSTKTPETSPPAASAGTRRPIELVPRLKDQGYERSQVDERRRWLEAKRDVRLEHVGAFTISSEDMRGNIENPIGAVQMPLAAAGPLVVHGEHAEGTFYVPLATTEGALVRSYERGMVVISRSGGATARVYGDENRISPVFFFADVGAAYEFCQRLPGYLEAIRNEAQSTTRHGRLLRVECLPVGREVIVNFCYFTADAQGMNMIAKATDKACRWIQEHVGGDRYLIFSGYNSEKRASGSVMQGGKGKMVTAGVLLRRSLVRAALRVTCEQMYDMWHHTMIGHVRTAAIGYNGHIANGLTALFIATGQDVANIANSSVGITNFELTQDGDLYVSVTLPSLSIATVGGGTGLGTSRECLNLLGCSGSGGALKLAEIIGATMVAGEISMGAAIASGEFVNAHETYGRNRPREETAT